MKKWIMVLSAAALALALTACGGSESKAVWTAGHAQDILDSGAFSEELEELDGDTAWMLYRLEEAGLGREELTNAVCYRASGSTCEELAVLSFDSEQAAAAAAAALESYVDGQIEENRLYPLVDISSLENAWIDQRGGTVLLVAAGDLDAAKDAVGA